MTGHKEMFRKGWAENDFLDEHEIPRDPALPQLAMMLDPDAMTEVLQGALPLESSAQGLKIARCRIANVSYRPGRECRVSYALGTDGSKNGHGDERFVTARVMSEERTDRILDRRLTAARDNRVAFTYLSDQQMVLTEFSNDFRVHSLHRLIDAGDFQRVARVTLGDGSAARPEWTEGETLGVSIVSYRPERSCLLRCVLGDGAKQQRVVYARIYRDDRGEQINQVMAVLWGGTGRGANQLVVAEPLGYASEQRILFQAPVDGVPLVELIGEADFLNHVAATARSLAAIHQSQISLDRSRCPVNDLDWIAAIARGFVRVLPESGERLMRILRQLQQSAPNLVERDRRMIHGDFSARQVLAAPGQVSIIDFDDACMADPCADLGTFLARLERHLQNPAMRPRMAEVFLQQYETAAQITLSSERINWYEALAFVRLAFSSCAQLKPGWSHRVDENLNRAQTLLAGHGR